jgi:hypothetical protein
VEKLREANIPLVLVSIGVPEKGRALIEHLQFDGGEDYLFVDPENRLYDALHLNRGVQRTFFNANTPYAFLDRIQKRQGLKTLLGVLGKWNKGIWWAPGWKRLLWFTRSLSLSLSHPQLISL